MKLSNLPIEVANFVCIFNDKELLDVFTTRVWPIFKKNKKIIWDKGEDNFYVFYNFEIKVINDDAYLVGKVIRDMTLKSSQKYEEASETLTRRNKSLDDSPTSFFLLRLVDHKLIVLKETTRAPDIFKIEKVIQRALFLHRKDLRKTQLAVFRRNKRKKRLTQELKDEFKTQFETSYPQAHFRITPIASFELAQKIFEDVKNVSCLNVSLLHTNHEDPAFRSNLMKQLREAKKVVGKGNTTTVKATIIDKDAGLSLSEAKTIIEDVAISDGNASFTLLAQDLNGVEVKIKDYELSIKDFIPASEIPTEEVKELYASAKLDQHSQKDKKLTPEEIQANQEKISQIFRELND